MIQKIRKPEDAFAFFGAELAKREQPCEASPGGAVRG